MRTMRAATVAVAAAVLLLVQPVLSSYLLPCGPGYIQVWHQNSHARRRLQSSDGENIVHGHSDDGYPTCEECPKDSLASNDRTECQPCPLGQRRSRFENACQSCPEGKVLDRDFDCVEPVCEDNEYWHEPSQSCYCKSTDQQRPWNGCPKDDPCGVSGPAINEFSWGGKCYCKVGRRERPAEGCPELVKANCDHDQTWYREKCYCKNPWKVGPCHGGSPSSATDNAVSMVSASATVDSAFLVSSSPEPVVTKSPGGCVESPCGKDEVLSYNQCICKSTGYPRLGNRPCSSTAVPSDCDPEREVFAFNTGCICIANGMFNKARSVCPEVPVYCGETGSSSPSSPESRGPSSSSGSCVMGPCDEDEVDAYGQCICRSTGFPKLGNRKCSSAVVPSKCDPEREIFAFNRACMCIADGEFKKQRPECPAAPKNCRHGRSPPSDKSPKASPSPSRSPRTHLEHNKSPSPRPSPTSRGGCNDSECGEDEVFAFNQCICKSTGYPRLGNRKCSNVVTPSDCDPDLEVFAYNTACICIADGKFKKNRPMCPPVPISCSPSPSPTPSPSPKPIKSPKPSPNPELSSPKSPRSPKSPSPSPAQPVAETMALKAAAPCSKCADDEVFAYNVCICMVTGFPKVATESACPTSLPPDAPVRPPCGENEIYAFDTGCLCLSTGLMKVGATCPEGGKIKKCPDTVPPSSPEEPKDPSPLPSAAPSRKCMKCAADEVFAYGVCTCLSTGFPKGKRESACGDVAPDAPADSCGPGEIFAFNTGCLCLSTGRMKLGDACPSGPKFECPEDSSASSADLLVATTESGSDGPPSEQPCQDVPCRSDEILSGNMCLCKTSGFPRIRGSPACPPRDAEFANLCEDNRREVFAWGIGCMCKADGEFKKDRAVCPNVPIRCGTSPPSDDAPSMPPANSTDMRCESDQRMAGGVCYCIKPFVPGPCPTRRH